MQSPPQLDLQGRLFDCLSDCFYAFRWFTEVNTWRYIGGGHLSKGGSYCELQYRCQLPPTFCIDNAERMENFP